MSGFLIICLVVSVWAALIYLMLLGWRRRGRRQAEQLGEFPVPPNTFGEIVCGPTTGLYVGSTLAPSWQNRIAVGDKGDRAVCRATYYAEGIEVTREGASTLWIPCDSITAIRTERGLAGKVMTADGLLVIRWQLPSGVELDSGIRADDKHHYREWIQQQPTTESAPDEEGKN